MAESRAYVLLDSKEDSARSEEGTESKRNALEEQDPVGTDRPNIAPRAVSYTHLRAHETSLSRMPSSA